MINIEKMNVPDSDQSDLYSPYFQLFLIQHDKVHHFSTWLKTQIPERTSIGSLRTCSYS